MKHVRRHRHVLLFLLSYDIVIGHWICVRSSCSPIRLSTSCVCLLIEYKTTRFVTIIVFSRNHFRVINVLLDLRLHLPTFLNVPPDPFALGRYLWHDSILEDALFRHKLVCCFVIGSVGFCRCFYLCSMRRIALRVPDSFHLPIGPFVVRRLSRRCLIRSKILYGCTFEAL
jgi:hypothetical protein